MVWKVLKKLEDIAVSPWCCAILIMCGLGFCFVFNAAFLQLGGSAKAVCCKMKCCEPGKAAFDLFHLLSRIPSESHITNGQAAYQVSFLYLNFFPVGST